MSADQVSRYETIFTKKISENKLQNDWTNLSYICIECVANGREVMSNVRILF